MESENSTDSNNALEILSLRSNLSNTTNQFPFEAEKEVFGNPMLLEEILKYLFFNTNDKISQKTVQATRLVEKSWLKTTTNLLKKSVRPFIELTLNENNSLQGTDYVNKIGKRLDQFVSRFGNSNRLPDSLLPFKLNLTLEYFREENLQSLLNCLTQLGNELIEIQVTFPKDGGSMPFIFPRLTLPLLRNLTFQFSTQESHNRQEDQEIQTFGSNNNGLWLLQLILNASVDVRTVIIPWSTSKNELVPRNFELLQLPPSITSLELKQTLKLNGVEVVLKNQLPKLENLVMRLQKTPLETNMLFKILDRFRKTLKSIQIGGATVNISTQPSTFIKLPLMEKLEILRINSSRCELSNENSSSLQVFLPKLKEVCLTYHTEALLGKWIQDSKFESVKDLVLCMVDEELRNHHPNYFRSFSMETMDKIHMTFPNVIHLTLTVNVSDISCLKYLFNNMVKLRSFTIYLNGNIDESSKWYIDSILLGLPVLLAKALSSHSDSFRSFELNRDKEPSIVNLSELAVLSIWTNEYPGTSQIYFLPENDGTTLLSDLLFKEGLLKMPKLAHLKLSRRYQISKEIFELWNRRGRRMTFGYPS